MSRFSTVRGIPVALFGAIWFVAAALLSVSGLTARPAVRESVPGYLFVAVDARARRHPVSRLRVVRPAESRVPPVPDHVCRRDRALPRVRCGHVFSHDYIASPRRPATSASLRAARWPSSSPCCFSPAPPRRSPSSRGRRVGTGRPAAAGRAAGADAGSDVGVRALVRLAAARAARRAVRRREGAGREVQRLPVPGVRPVVPAVQADLREVRSASIPGAGQAGAEGLSAEPRLQRRAGADAFIRPRATRRSPCGSPARTTRPRRWRSGSTRTSRR